MWLGLATQVALAEPGPTYAEVDAILQARCVVCHSGPGAPLGLRLDSYEGTTRGSDRGAVAVPGKPQDSELVMRVRGTRLPRMPLTGPPYLSEAEIALIAGWIAQGMPPPAAGTPPRSATRALPAPGEPVRFDHVAPILLQRCVKCHSDPGILGAPPEGLKLTAWRDVVASGERAVVIPGNPAASELIRRIKGQSLPRMPFDGPPYLSEEEVGVLERWVAGQAPDALGNAAPVPVGARVRLGGTLTGRWQLDDLPLVLSPGVRLKKAPRIGDRAEVRGVVRADGTIEVNRLRAR